MNMYKCKKSTDSSGFSLIQFWNTLDGQSGLLDILSPSAQTLHARAIILCWGGLKLKRHKLWSNFYIFNGWKIITKTKWNYIGYPFSLLQFFWYTIETLMLCDSCMFKPFFNVFANVNLYRHTWKSPNKKPLPPCSCVLYKYSENKRQTSLYQCDSWKKYVLELYTLALLLETSLKKRTVWVVLIFKKK